MIHASSYFSFSTAGASSTSASSYVPCHLRFVPYQPTPLLLVTHIWIHIEFLHLVIPVPKSYPNAQSLHELIPGCSFETPMAKNFRERGAPLFQHRGLQGLLVEM